MRAYATRGDAHWKPPSEGSGLELRQNFRIADIDPAAFDREAGHLVAGAEHGGDGIRQLVFATRRFLEARGEIEDHRFEDVDAGVVPHRRAWLEQTIGPQLIELDRTRLFD